MSLAFTIANLEAIISDIAPKFVSKALVNNTSFFDMVPREPGMGKKVQWLVETSKNGSARTFEPGGAGGPAGAVKTQPAELDYGKYTASFEFTDYQWKIIQQSGDTMQIVNFISDQLESASVELAALIDSDMHTGSGSNSVTGLNTAIGTGSYANIDRGVYTSFASYVKDAGSAAVSTTLLDDVFNNVFSVNLAPRAGSWIWMCDYAQWDKIAALSGIVVTPQQNVPAGQGRFDKLIGATNLYYKGIPVVNVPGATAQRVDLINLDDLRVNYVQGSSNQSSGGRGAKAPEMIDIKVVPGEFDTATVHMFCYPQMRLRNPKKSSGSLQALAA